MANTDRELFLRMESWEEAVRLSKGYEDEFLICSYLDSLLNNPPWRKIDSLDFTQREIELACAIQKAISLSAPLSVHKKTKVRVLDIGGGNGYLGVALRRMLPELLWEWIVIESNACANAYSQFEDDANIKWISHDNFDWNTASSIALFSCSLQYLENPEETLKKIAKNCDCIILMRLPILDSAEHILTKQTFYEGLHQVPDASWPHWFFSRSCLFAKIAEIGEVAYKWKTSSESYLFEGNNIFLEGVLIKSRKNAASIAECHSL